jgi:alkylation response protein AidB-like acyl-CoA dehydrogenase
MTVAIGTDDFKGLPPAGSLTLTAQVRRFVEDEVLPYPKEAPGDFFPQQLVDRMVELKLFGTIIPTRYGGLGLSMVEHVAIMEEVARGWVSLAGVLNPHVLCCHMLLTSGTEEQRERWLPRLANGSLRASFSLTEPDAGSDAQAIIATGAKDDDGSWRLRGRKRWITNGLGSGLVLVLVKTDTNVQPAHKGITCFIVEKKPWAMNNDGDFAGVAIEEVIDKMGDRGVDTTDLLLDGYRCQADAILGGESGGLGAGFRQVMVSIEAGRIGASALCIGIGQRCLEIAATYAKQRSTFGRPIAEHQAVQFAIADMATSLAAARLLVRDAAGIKDKGQRADLQAGMAKLFATDAAVAAASACFRIHGANGYSKHCEAERLFRDALSLVSAEGPAEIQRTIIGRSVIQAITGV